MNVILGRARQIEQFMKGRNEGVAVNLSNAMGDASEVDQCGESGGVFHSAFLANYILALCHAQVGSCGRLGPTPAKPTRMRRRLVGKFDREVSHV